MSNNGDGRLKDVLSQTPAERLKQSHIPKVGGIPNREAIVVGIYGLPGAGKTFLLEQLKQDLDKDQFVFYEGSQVIASMVPGGLDAFQTLDEQKKSVWRQRAIEKIGQDCASSGRVAVVAGHFMFWSERDADGCSVYTQNDLDTFTHILYLDFPPEFVAQRRMGDMTRIRPSESVAHLEKWQQAEKTQLRDLCRLHEILFLLVTPQPSIPQRVSMLLRDFKIHSEEYNLSCAEKMLDETIKVGTGQRRIETVLVLDADRTLAAEDAGMLFWTRLHRSRSSGTDYDCPLKKLFGGMGYSYNAFRQAALLYEEAVGDDEFDALCEDIASTIRMHREFVSLLRAVAEQEHVRAVVVTCGLRCVWEKVLTKEGLSKKIGVIGGGRVADGFVVTAKVKAALVSRLRCTYQAYVWAFGDSPLDLEMLCKADEAIVVVGEEQLRSKTMDKALMRALDSGRLRARQALLPRGGSLRLDTTRLPLVDMTDRKFIESVLYRIQVCHATDKTAAKLLMTPMRNASIEGPALRHSHHQVGWFLAIELVTDMIGVEDYSIPHVQGHNTSGYRLKHENQTSIVALMRGGEPMALGISEAFPLALFVHANCPEDIKDDHLQGRHTVVLVDSVVNSGKTVIEFVQRIRCLYAAIRIVVAAGVVQAQSIAALKKALVGYGEISVVALRISDNKYTGTGTTDTGNRLFNTTHLC